MIETLRIPKLFGVSLFDSLGTLGGAYIISKSFYSSDKSNYMILPIFILLIIIGIISHIATSTYTMFGYYLGISTLDQVKNARIDRMNASV
jgi:hypothetical protein